MKFKNLQKRETNKMKKKYKKYFPPTHPKKALHFPSLLLLCNAIIHVKDTKVVQFKRKFHYVISGREFFTTYKIYKCTRSN